MQLLTEDERALAWFAGWWARASRTLTAAALAVLHLAALIAVTTSAPPPALALLGGLAAGSVTVAAGLLHIGTPGRIMRRGR